MTEPKQITVLLVEDDPQDVYLVRELLSETRHESRNSVQFRLEHVERLATGLAKLDSDRFDVVLIDLSLPDSQGLQSLPKIRDHAADVPIVVLTGLNDEELAVSAVEGGAQDYIVKSELVGNVLGRSLRYAVERHRLQKELKQKSIVDELTGLYNRRGFFAFGQHEYKRAKRDVNTFMVLFADLDGLKRVNDTQGHAAGDRLIADAALILRSTFRDSDVIGRLGGDEFAVILHESEEQSSEAVAARLNEQIRSHNAAGSEPHELSMSVGISTCDSAKSISFDELVSKADAEMYVDKKRKKGARR